MERVEKRMVVVTTDKDRRGVFCGELVEHDKKTAECILENAQMAVYWSAETHGVLGLAKTGPKEGSRISPIIPRIELTGISSIMTMTAEAVAEWRKELWD